MKKYDAFIFFNELELLEIRLNILNEHVDYFVIIECTKTFSGLDKELFFEKNKHLFEKYEDKIIHLIIDNSPNSFDEARERLSNSNTSDIEKEVLNSALTSSSVPDGALHWLREFYQRESIKKALVGLNDDDICFVSDVDEIWNPNSIIDHSKDDIFKLRQLPYVYFLNNRSDEPWAGTLVTNYRNIKNECLNHLRIRSVDSCTLIENGGWHFTYQGGADRVKKKIESYGHQEFNNDGVKNEIENRITNNQDFIGRGFRFWVDESELPEYILKNRENYVNWMK